MYIPNEKIKLNKFKKVAIPTLKDLFIRGINPQMLQVPQQSYNEGEYIPEGMNKTEMLDFAQSETLREAHNREKHEDDLPE